MMKKRIQIPVILAVIATMTTALTITKSTIAIQEENKNNYIDEIAETLYNKTTLNITDVNQGLKNSEFSFEVDELIVGTIEEFNLTPLNSNIEIKITTKNKTELIDVLTDNVVFVDTDSNLTLTPEVYNTELFLLSSDVGETALFEGLTIYAMLERHPRYSEYVIFVVLNS